MNRLILTAWLTVVGLAGDVAARFRNWIDLPIAAWNIGPAKRLPDALRQRVPAIVAIAEASDQWGKGEIIALLREAGYRIIAGTKPGQPATPLGYDPGRVRLITPKRYLVAKKQFAGVGAGPPVLKEKWEIGGLFEILDTGREAWFFADHWVASQQHRRRFGIALRIANRIVLLGHKLRRPVFSIGDKNAIPKSAALAPLRAAGWLMNHTVGRMLGTHHRRAIDQIWWQARRWIRFLRHQAVNTGSDHDLLIAWFAIRPKKKEKRHAPH